MVTTCHTHGSCLGRLTVIRARLALLLILVSQMDVETTSLSPCKGTISGTVGSFQSGGVFATGRALTIVNSPMSGYGKGHESPENAFSLLLSYVGYY